MSTRRREGGCLTFRLCLRIYHISSPNQFSLWYKITGVLTVKTHFKATEAKDNKVCVIRTNILYWNDIAGVPEGDLAEHKTVRATETEKILKPGLLGVT